MSAKKQTKKRFYLMLKKRREALSSLDNTVPDETLEPEVSVVEEDVVVETEPTVVEEEKVVKTPRKKKS